ncbi:MAG: glycosyltransferase family 4 protein [Candidatus Limisoma sp.]
MTLPINIGFDAKRIVRNRTGLGNYCRTLVNDLAEVMPDRRLRLYTPIEGCEDLRERIVARPNVEFVLPRNAVMPGLHSLWRSHGIVRDLKADGVGIYHGLTGELPYGLRRSGIVGVVTIHDLIFLRHPEYYHWYDAWIYKQKFKLACREATRIIAISECTKRDIVEFGNVEPERIDVVYQSCSTRFNTRVTDEQRRSTSARYSLPDRYVLNVGTVEERKNVGLAVEALRDLPDDVHLVIVGRRTQYADRVDALARKYSVTDRVHFLSNLPTDELYAIYQMAECFVYPSRYEGFGIPIIEAIQSGLPVVACTGSCLEEAGGDSCLYVSPDDASALAAAINDSLRGAPGREQRIARAQEYARRFENLGVAEQVVDVYRRAVEGR